MLGLEPHLTEILTVPKPSGFCAYSPHIPPSPARSERRHIAPAVSDYVTRYPEISIDIFVSNRSPHGLRGAVVSEEGRSSGNAR
jgi:hypothetical protein